ncbi:nucleolar transcription factor 1 [Dermatophagoides farinae]|uniref:nucleolar transcription factor 1 n=1 Tax=Dermatophagoides farinae TaxID=6954 RepID=UPI003F6119DB
MEQQQKTIKEEILDSDANKSSDSSMNTKKKRKKSKLNSDETDDNSMTTLANYKSDNNDDNDEMSMMMMIMNDGVNNGVVETELLELSNDTVITDNFDNRWSTNDLKTLLENIKKCLPQNDLTKYSTTLEKTINWDQVKFKHFDANECKECAVNIINGLRKYRTLTEMLGDAFEWTNKRHLNHPNRPKKPCSLFLRYFLEKRPKLQQQYPNKSVAELAKILSTKFAKLSDKKRAKYRRDYEEDLIKYREQMIQFRTKYPELFSQRMRTGEKIGPEKPRTPFQLYRLSKMKKIPTDTDEDPKAIQDRIREQWNNISEKKHYKFIKKSLKDQERYNQELEEFMAANPTYTAPVIMKPLLTKNEQELRRRYQGMPMRPPNSGYMLFSQIMLKEFKDVPSKEKMVLVAKRWKEMTIEERSKYNEDAQNMMSEYIRKFDEYVHTLPDDEKKQLLIEQGHFKLPSEKNIFSSNKQFMPTSSIVSLAKEMQKKTAAIDQTAMIAYQMNEMQRLKPIYSDKTNAELMDMINEQWSSMPAIQKTEYLEVAESMQDFLPSNTKTKKSSTTTTTATRRKESSKDIKFKDVKESEFFLQTGLRKPRRCGFTTYCSSILSTMINKTTQERMRYASEQWKQMSVEQKQYYLQLQSSKCEMFEKLFNRFKKDGTLPSKKEMKEFNKAGTITATTDEMLELSEIKNEKEMKKVKKRKLDNNNDDDDSRKTIEWNENQTLSSTSSSSSPSLTLSSTLKSLKKASALSSSSSTTTTTITPIESFSSTTKSKKKFSNCLYDDSSSSSENDDDVMD